MVSSFSFQVYWIVFNGRKKKKKNTKIEVWYKTSTSPLNVSTKREPIYLFFSKYFGISRAFSCFTTRTFTHFHTEWHLFHSCQIKKKKLKSEKKTKHWMLNWAFPLNWTNGHIETGTQFFFLDCGWSLGWSVCVWLWFWLWLWLWLKIN